MTRPVQQRRDISGPALFAAAGGALLMYAAIKHISITDALRSLLKGQAPASAPDAGPQASAVGSVPQGQVGEHGGPGTDTSTANQALGQMLAVPYGWGFGNEWNSLVMLWNRESGWQSNIMNPSSGAFGIAQALHHPGPGSQANNVSVIIAGQGPAVRNVNMYPNQKANQGDPASQIIWGLQYIKSTYGSPSAAWAHEQQFGWY